jgi:hypothetical protein
MWLSVPSKADLPLPTWRYALSCHGYWLDGQRVGYVAKGRLYLWALDATDDCGECTTLRAAKRKVEAAFRERYSWRFPVSRGR